jgi:hypothetical protein
MLFVIFTFSKPDCMYLFSRVLIYNFWDGPKTAEYKFFNNDNFVAQLLELKRVVT